MCARETSAESRTLPLGDYRTILAMTDARSMLSSLRARVAAPSSTIARAVAVFLVMGVVMNALGKALHIAEFVMWWQVASCYLLYVLPLALAVRGLPVVEQYAWCVLTMAPLELVAYTLGTSKAHPGNIIDRVLGERNFTLAMVLFCALLPMMGNALVRRWEALGPPAPPA